MLAAGLDGVLGQLLADAAHVHVAVAVDRDAVRDQERVVGGLAHARDQLKHVRIVVEQRALLHVRDKLGLGLGIEPENEYLKQLL